MSGLDDSIHHQIADKCLPLGIDFRFAHNSAPGLTHARNLAADLAAADVLLYLDDDVDCHANLIEEVVKLFADPRVAAVTCTVVEPTFASPSARLYQLGYQLAGWWRVRPRVRPSGSPPRILANPDIAVPARWLSGAAMALRRDLVRRYRFDESLTTYALGEDRDMGYRLAPNHWLIESRRARVIHRRDAAARTDPRRLGFMTAFNYLYILFKTCRLAPGDWLLIAWSFTILAIMHVAWSLFGNRRAHLAELRGMIDGLLTYARAATPPQSLIPSPPSPVTPPRQRTSNPAQLNPQSPIPNPQSSIRALFVTNRLEPGGAELLLLRLAERLPAHHVQPLILCLKDAGPLAPRCRAAGIPVYDDMLHFKTDAAVIPRVRRVLLEESIDVLVVAHSGGDRMFWSTLAANLAQTPVVVWSHWFPQPGKRHFERANRALYRLVDAYVALGETHRRALIRCEHLPAGRITVIHNALDLARFLNNVPRHEARRRLRLADDHVGIAIVANMRTEKRHDVFIEAAHRLAAADPRLRFFIIGDGPNRDAVQAAAARSGLDHETLRLLGPRDDVPELLAGLDISCLCSEIECFSMTMLEAAAADCPFIGPNTGCLPDFLKHRENGLMIKPADVASLADAIHELASDAPLRHRLAQNARRQVLQNYDLDAMTARFADLLHSVCDHSFARPGSKTPMGDRPHESVTLSGARTTA